MSPASPSAAWQCGKMQALQANEIALLGPTWSAQQKQNIRAKKEVPDFFFFFCVYVCFKPTVLHNSSCIVFKRFPTTSARPGKI